MEQQEDLMDGGSSNAYGAGGGGGTDFRINSTSLYARVIVAGGGAGMTRPNYGTASGGYGGGSSGGTPSTSQTYSGRIPGSGATQTTGNQFGIAASGSEYSAGGGGGGWYGGTAGANTTPGGGGSGYVYTSSTASSYPSGCLLNSSYYLSNAATCAGNTSFVSPTGGNETGHSGNGYARITLVE